MRKHALFFLIAIVAARAASAQTVSIGVIGGVSLLDRHDESRRYIVGPSIEFRLPAGFAVEVDALYQRLGDSARFFNIPPGVNLLGVSAENLTNIRQRANSWEFPVLGKYYFRRASSWQPFLGAGFAFRTIGVHSVTTSPSTDANGVPQTSSTKNDFRLGLNAGVVAAAGVRFHAGHFAFLPEVRYTRLGGDGELARKNEAAFVLGISF